MIDGVTKRAPALRAHVSQDGAARCRLGHGEGIRYGQANGARMTDTAIARGGARNDAQSRVSADQGTIVGDGTTENPLRATGGGSISVATDGVTILGNGTAGEPLRTSAPAVGIPVIAAGLVNVDGTFLSQIGFATLTHPGPGQYSFQLSNPPVIVNNAVPVATILNGSVAGQVTFIIVPGGFDVVTYNAAGVATDRLFSIAVFDLT